MYVCRTKQQKHLQQKHLQQQFLVPTILPLCQIKVNQIEVCRLLCMVGLTKLTFIMKQLMLSNRIFM